MKLAPFAVAVFLQMVEWWKSHCSEVLFSRPMQAAELPVDSLQAIPGNVLQNEKEFWVCSSCSQVYWRGQQFVNCKSHLTDRLKALTVT